MTDNEFQDLVKALQDGNEQLLDKLFLAHYSYVTEYLEKEFPSGNYRCSLEDAKDVFMDGLLKLRAELLKGKVENKNLRGYLVTICRNSWLKRKKKEKISIPLDLDKVEYYLGEKEGYYNNEYNPLLLKEEEQRLKEEEQQRIEAFSFAWSKLGEKCSRLLKAFYLDGTKLKDLQVSFGYNSYDTIKSMRRKCFNQLLKWKEAFFQK